MEAKEQFKNSPLHDKTAILGLMDQLMPVDMMKVVDLLQVLTRPVEQEQPAMTAEEILQLVCCYSDTSELNPSDDITIEEALEAMHEYAAQSMPSEEIRKLLIEFNAFMNENEFDGRIPLIKDCIDEFLKSRMK